MSAPLRVLGVPVAIPVAIGIAWLIALVAEGTGVAGLIDHEALVERGALPLFLLAWQLMLAAMMLPSMLPMLRLFLAVSPQQPHPSMALAAFLGGYALVWSVFGAVAFASDVALHEIVGWIDWLAARPQLIGAAVLAVAGAFQFSTLKDRCLDQCRHPAAFLLPRYRRGIGEAFRLGRAHGLFCLGCCWALMLLMFATGMADLRWMAGLTALMVYEKVGRHGRRLVPIVGVALLASAAFVLLV
jgi:predicted metal-binding membrane protein